MILKENQNTEIEMERYYEEFKMKWQNTIFNIAKKLSEHYKIQIPQGLNAENAAEYLEKITQDNLTDKKNIQFLILSSSPSTGKSTVGRQLERYGYKKLPRYTTRSKRKNEIEGKDYFFVDKKQYTNTLNYEIEFFIILILKQVQHDITCFSISKKGSDRDAKNKFSMTIIVWCIS